MPTFLVNHLRALTLGPTQRAMLESWMDGEESAQQIVSVLREVARPADGPLKVRQCCPANLATRGVHHDAYCTGPVPVER